MVSFYATNKCKNFTAEFEDATMLIEVGLVFRFDI